MKQQPREGILTVTYTRASQKSLQQRDSHFARRITGKVNDGYITELCIDTARCDVICHLPVLASTVQVGPLTHSL